MRGLLFFVFSLFCIGSSGCHSPQQIITNLLEEEYQYSPLEQSSPSILGNNECNELDFDTMLSVLNRTQTFFGYWGLKHLTNPTSEQSRIDAAQKRLRLLLDQPELFDRIAYLLHEIQQGQRSLLMYYNDYSRMCSDVQSLYYYYTPGSQRLNKSKLALDASYLLSYSALIGNKILFFGIMDLMTKIAMTGTFSSLDGISLGTLLGNPIRSNMPWLVQLADEERYAQCLKDTTIRQDVYAQGSFGDRSLLIGVGASESYQTPWQQGMATIVGVLSLTMSQICYDVGYAVLFHAAYDKATFLWRIMTQLKQNTVQLARVMRAVEELAEHMYQHPELAHWESLRPLFLVLHGTEYWSEPIQSLFDLLSHATFDMDSSTYWYSRGRVLLAHNQMEEVAYELIPLWHALGYLDATMSIARLYKEHQETINPFCLVEITEQETPLIVLEDFWLPLTVGTQIVNNSIAMGSEEFPSNVIITGPNGGGKSTVMKGVCWAVILGQSWGIVPARSAAISLFSALKTSFSPTEDMSQGLSTFMAEKARMTHIESFIQDEGAAGCMLLALDEPYRGTVEVEAADRVCAFCNEIASNNRVGMLLATHLEAPTSLEGTSSSFANYQMEFAEDCNGEVFRTFRLIPGAAQWWFNDPVMRKKIIDSLGV